MCGGEHLTGKKIMALRGARGSWSRRGDGWVWVDGRLSHAQGGGLRKGKFMVAVGKGLSCYWRSSFFFVLVFLLTGYGAGRRFSSGPEENEDFELEVQHEVASLSLKYPEQSKISLVLGKDPQSRPVPIEWLRGAFGSDSFVELVSSPPVFRTSRWCRVRKSALIVPQTVWSRTERT